MEGTANWRIGDIVVVRGGNVNRKVGKIVSISCDVIPQNDIDNARSLFVYTIQLQKVGTTLDPEYTGIKIRVEEPDIIRLRIN